jgi:cytochrome c-type biogenesis protein CcmH
MIQRCLRTALLAGAIIAHAGAAMAVEPEEKLADPQLEMRARVISAELRCLVCQNQSIDDSDAPLAKDLRVLVRERLSAGDSDGQVMTFLVDRYGDFILLRPKLDAKTYALWIAPLLILLGGIVLARRAMNPSDAQSAMTAPPDLTAEEQQRLREVLEKYPSADGGQAGAI